jgi:DNA end-binding protein Ku
VCRADGKEVPWEDIVRGYEYQEGDYVILEKEDFEKANVEKTHIIEITSFVHEEEIDSIFFEKPYFLAPQKSGAKAYSLLREALKQAKVVGVGSFVLRNREHLTVIKPYGDILVLNQLRYHDEIRDYKDLNLPAKTLVGEEEIKMAQKLIKQLTKKFKPTQYEDTYLRDLKKIIEAKAKGKELKKPRQVPAVEVGKVVDIMSLLKKSLAESKKKAA